MLVKTDVWVNTAYLCFSSLEQFQEEFEDISKEEQVGMFLCI